MKARRRKAQLLARRRPAAAAAADKARLDYLGAGRGLARFINATLGEIEPDVIAVGAFPTSGADDAIDVRGLIDGLVAR
ncbi:hypothetical protein MW290_25550 [Aquincola tertiaricarbonis]|uniref:Uncharacterized protein n=1 Tax=Aquincola tertiaricarbonis TaxID=391953 RepID=A0ABY4SAK4_AQUTE|nr:hypothetical protein [Aquincola tertiaricarbonis]URI08937.1 hypothetical protein MW290_25550 [Aquincola tertiaricarbonis]